METEIRIDLGKLFEALWRKKGKILLAGLLGAVLALALTLAVVPKYETAVTFFAETPDKARQAAVLLELEQTLRETAEEAGLACDGDMVRAEEVKETGFLRVTVVSADAWEGKVVADALYTVLPRRAETVLGGGVQAADRPVLAEKTTVPNRGLAGAVGMLVGVLGSCGVVGFCVVFEVGKKEKTFSG